MDIAHQIDKLIQLQEMDSVIYKLKVDVSEKPLMIAELKHKIEQEKKAFEDSKSSIKHLQARRKEKEIDLGTKEEQINKLNSQLFKLKTNKEYETMQLEIGKLKADSSVLEEDILKLMEDTDQADVVLKESQNQLGTKEQELNSQIKRIEDEIKVLEAELVNYDEKRKGIVFEIDPKVLSSYEKILDVKEGLALVPIVNDACGGCYMHLPPQVLSLIHI